MSSLGALLSKDSHTGRCPPAPRPPLGSLNPSPTPFPRSPATSAPTGAGEVTSGSQTGDFLGFTHALGLWATSTSLERGLPPPWGLLPARSPMAGAQGWRSARWCDLRSGRTPQQNPGPGVQKSPLGGICQTCGPLGGAAITRRANDSKCLITPLRALLLQ